jgi:hypothetical protein
MGSCPPRLQRFWRGCLLLASAASFLVLASPAEAATQLNPAPIAGGDVLRFQISPDGSRVIYRADQNTDGVDELFSVPIAGGTATRLNQPLVAGRAVLAFAISPDSSRVVYSADQVIDDVVELFSVPLAGGPAIKLNPTLVAGGACSRFQRGQLCHQPGQQPRAVLPGRPGRG